MAFVLSALAYPLVAGVVLGPPNRRAPWIPSEQDKAISIAVHDIEALGNAGAGWLVGNLRAIPATRSSSRHRPCC